jgi:hypothetical protein
MKWRLDGPSLACIAGAAGGRTTIRLRGRVTAKVRRLVSAELTTGQAPAALLVEPGGTVAIF